MHPFFYIKKNFSFLEKIALTHVFYPKNIIRAKVPNTKKNQNIKILDNYSNVTHIILKKKQLNVTGKSFFSKTFFFKHKFLSNLKFESFVHCYKKNCFVAFKYKNIFAKQSITLNNSLYLLNSINGGYNVFSLGFRGFLPKRQAQVVLGKKKKKKTVVNLPWKKSQIKNKIILIDRAVFLVKNYFALKLPFEWIDISLTKLTRKRIFCKSRKKFSKFLFTYMFIISLSVHLDYHKKKEKILIEGKKQYFNARSTRN